MENLKRKNLQTKLEVSLKNLNQEEFKKDKIIKNQELTQKQFNKVMRVMAKTLHKKRVKV